jgi:hypothetical protein
MINIVKKRSSSNEYIYCIYVDSLLVLQTRKIAAISPWMKLKEARANLIAEDLPQICLSCGFAS